MALDNSYQETSAKTHPGHSAGVPAVSIDLLTLRNSSMLVVSVAYTNNLISLSQCSGCSSFSVSGSLRLVPSSIKRIISRPISLKSSRLLSVVAVILSTIVGPIFAAPR